MLTFLLTALALAAPPTGNLDRGDVDLVGGWARDPDFPGPVPVHIYIDGHLAHDLSANSLRSDLPFSDQEHGFTWVPPLLGPGSHSVVAYAIGVNAVGMPDGDNPALNNSPRTSSGECSDFPEPALSWCRGVGGYFANRHATTDYLYTRNYRVGVDTSYGGTILEFYGADHSTSLVSQHGGAAIQLSIWGYDPVGPAAWFGKGIGVCDPTPYPSQAACEAQNTSCRRYGHSRGDHVTNCGSVQSCVEWGAGAPFNPIQAQAVGCGWLSTTNDVASVTADASSIEIVHTDPFHFTQDNAMLGLDFGQRVVRHSAFVEVQYSITYDGTATLSTHPQEIPAVFPGDTMSEVYFFYDGDEPWTGQAVTRMNESDGGIYRVPDQASYPHPTFDGTISERWVTGCNASRDRCMTIAMFSDALREFSLGPASRGYGYMTPIGDFAIAPGMDEQFTLLSLIHI